MKNLKITITTKILATFLTLSVFLSLAQAEVKFRLKPYIMPIQSDGDLGINGTIGEFNVGMSDAISKGNDILGLDFEISGGGLSLLSQIQYTSLSDTRPEVPSLVFDAGKLDYEQFYLTEVLGVTILGDREQGYIDLVAGGRFATISSDLEVRGGPEDRRKYKDSDDWIDPVVGFYSMFYLTDETTFSLGGDVGGFDVASDLTWQAMASFDFALSDKAWLSLGYRAISFDYEQGGFVFDILSQGPTVGVDFRF